MCLLARIETWIFTIYTENITQLIVFLLVTVLGLIIRFRENNYEMCVRFFMIVDEMKYDSDENNDGILKIYYQLILYYSTYYD